MSLEPTPPRFTDAQLLVMNAMISGHYAHRQPAGSVLVVHPCGNCPAWFVSRQGDVTVGVQPPWEYVHDSSEG